MINKISSAILNRCLDNKNDLLEEAAIGSVSGIQLYIGRTFLTLEWSVKLVLTLMIARQILRIVCYIEMRKSACNIYLLADAQTSFEYS